MTSLSDYSCRIPTTITLARFSCFKAEKGKFERGINSTHLSAFPQSPRPGSILVSIATWPASVSTADFRVIESYPHCKDVESRCWYFVFVPRPVVFNFGLPVKCAYYTSCIPPYVPSYSWVRNSEIYHGLLHMV
jgi:hypothetical protein